MIGNNNKCEIYTKQFNWQRRIDKKELSIGY